MDNPKNIVTIASLEPTQNNRNIGIIKARVIRKSGLLFFSNTKFDRGRYFNKHITPQTSQSMSSAQNNVVPTESKGKFFTIDLKDSSGIICAAIFWKQYDKFFEFIEVNKVYVISKFNLKSNEHSPWTTHGYEMQFSTHTEVELYPTVDVDIEGLCKVAGVMKIRTEDDDIKENFTPISQVAAMRPRTMVSIIGICKDVGQICKNRRRTSFRKLTLADTSNAEVILTLWRDDAQRFIGQVGTVILLDNGCINDHAGVDVTNRFSQMEIDPDTPEAHKLRRWFADKKSTISKTTNEVNRRSDGLLDIKTKCDFPLLDQDIAVVAKTLRGNIAVNSTEGLCKALDDMKIGIANEIDEVQNSNLVPISDVAKLKPKTKVDLIGVCTNIGEISKSKNGMPSRDLTLVDTSNAAVILTIRSDDARKFSGQVGAVILLKTGRVNTEKGVTAFKSYSVMEINPDTPESDKLRRWFDIKSQTSKTNAAQCREGGQK